MKEDIYFGGSQRGQSANTDTTSTNKEDWGDCEPEAMNIVYQIGDLLYETLPPGIAHEHFVKARQATNDRAIDFAQSIINKVREEGIEKERRRIVMLMDFALKDNRNWTLDAFRALFITKEE